MDVTSVMDLDPYGPALILFGFLLIGVLVWGSEAALGAWLLFLKALGWMNIMQFLMEI